MREELKHDGRTVLVFLTLGPLVGLSCLGLVTRGPTGIVTVPLAVLTMAVFAGILGGGKLALAMMLLATAVPALPSLLVYLLMRRAFAWRVAAAAAVVAAMAAWIAVWALVTAETRAHAPTPFPALVVASGLAALICCWADRHVRRLRGAEATPRRALAPPPASDSSPG